MKALFGTLILAMLILAANCSKKPDPEDSCGFIQNEYGQRVSWNSRRPVPMYIDSSFPDRYHEAIRRAMATWEKGAGGTVFQYAGVVASNKPQQDNRNIIYWLPSWDTRSGRQQADTLVYWVDNQIIEADVRVNAQDFTYSDGQSSGALDVESLIVHELGHVLGLAHNNDKQTVMSPFLATSFLRRQLFAEDIEHVKCEY